VLIVSATAARALFDTHVPTMGRTIADIWRRLLAVYPEPCRIRGKAEYVGVLHEVYYRDWLNRSPGRPL
jgi:hypothetical protein